jgi:hypothetical protein
MKNSNFVSILLISLTLAVGLSVDVQSASAKQKYCGTDRSGRFIPDRPLGYDFSGACKAHDQCLEGGGNKRQCLQVFDSELLRVCNNLPQGKRTILRWTTNEGRYSRCLKTAKIYSTAVLRFQ